MWKVALKKVKKKSHLIGRRVNENQNADREQNWNIKSHLICWLNFVHHRRDLQ